MVFCWWPLAYKGFQVGKRKAGLQYGGSCAREWTLADRAGKIKNPYQRRPIPAGVLEQTVNKYNGFVDAGKDSEFGAGSNVQNSKTPVLRGVVDPNPS